MKTILRHPGIYTLGLVTVLFAGGCAEVIEKDLSGKKVQLVAPSNGVNVPDSVVLTFAWDSVDGASQYRLQVATPSFDSVVLLLTDTNVTGTSLALPMATLPGSYQWRVMAKNNTSLTSFCIPWNFFVR